MTIADRIYELVKVMPEEQATAVLNFVEHLNEEARSSTITQPAIAQGILTGLRGIAKRSGTALTDEQLQAEYTDYLTEKYQ